MRLRSISKLLADDYAERILVATYSRAQSAQEVSDKFDIPIAACYRKVHELEEHGLLKCERMVTTPKGKSMKLYRSQLKSAHILFENGKFKVKLEFRYENEKNNKWIHLEIPRRK